MDGLSGDHIELHHVGGHLHGRLIVDVTRRAHEALGREQAQYAHLLRRPNLPVAVGVALVLLDMGALLELIGRELRRLAHLLLRPYTMTPRGRTMLDHPRKGRSENG